MADIAHDDLAQGWTKTTSGVDLWRRTNKLRWLELPEAGVRLQQKWVNVGNGKEEWREIPVVSGLHLKSEQ